jgi:CheY-like chemotaxis protein
MTMIFEHEILNANILIVDDQQANVFLLEEMLREAGYACIASTTDPHAYSGPT